MRGGRRTCGGLACLAALLAFLREGWEPRWGAAPPLELCALKSF